MKRLFLIALAASLAVPAGARAMEDERSISIPLAGVRFDNDASVTALRSRIARAARQVCDVREPSLKARSESWRCRDSAIERAEQQLSRLAGQQKLALATDSSR